jgi:hypothetical protein
MDALTYEDCRGGGVRICNSRLVMNSFRYFRDVLFLVCCALYAGNRWLLKPHVRSAFLHNHFNDLLLIPCALPPLLWMQRRLGLRDNDNLPSAGEIALYVSVWSILFEVIGPRVMPHAVGDVYDVVAYIGGGVLAGMWWHRNALHRFAGMA